MCPNPCSVEDGLRIAFRSTQCVGRDARRVVHANDDWPARRLRFRVAGSCRDRTHSSRQANCSKNRGQSCPAIHGILPPPFACQGHRVPAGQGPQWTPVGLWRKRLSPEKGHEISSIPARIPYSAHFDWGLLPLYTPVVQVDSGGSRRNSESASSLWELRCGP